MEVINILIIFKVIEQDEIAKETNRDRQEKRTWIQALGNTRQRGNQQTRPRENIYSDSGDLGEHNVMEAKRRKC